MLKQNNYQPQVIQTAKKNSKGSISSKGKWSNINVWVTKRKWKENENKKW